MTLTPAERREQCNPVLIGILVAFASPLSSIIWGIRQRSWSLALVPYALIFAFAMFVLIDTKEEKLPSGVKYPLQLSSGIVAYEISKVLKEKASKSKG